MFIQRLHIVQGLLEDALAPGNEDSYYTRSLVQSWLDFVRNGTLPVAPPLVRSHVFSDSEHQDGQGSGAGGAVE